MVNFIEFRNETNKPIVVSVCRSKTTGLFYAHIGYVDHGSNTEVPANYYAIVEIKEVEM